LRRPGRAEFTDQPVAVLNGRVEVRFEVRDVNPNLLQAGKILPGSVDVGLMAPELLDLFSGQSVWFWHRLASQEVEMSRRL
jgi:hypothetical protein